MLNKLQILLDFLLKLDYNKSVIKLQEKKMAKKNKDLIPAICVIVLILGAALALVGIFLNFSSLSENNALRFISDASGSILGSSVSPIFSIAAWSVLCAAITAIVYGLALIMAFKASVLEFLFKNKLISLLIVGVPAVLVVFAVLFLIGSLNPMTGTGANIINDNIELGPAAIVVLIGAIVSLLGGIGAFLTKK